ncbi:TraQ conjugal transfer family protein [Chryseobacterium populi]|uniref:DUF3872 domain-containing protein n=1 Tax=Chryseobacterium populi TaxID=1144316 RepID=J2KMQ9_9FLAO|nr:TraQ conjugal transfer family protein [Chryseobacterium populi]EJL74378.1 hypothetical protein PMI13_01117 [Chryseobacterium populi]
MKYSINPLVRKPGIQQKLVTILFIALIIFIALISIFLTSCQKELEIQTNFPFELEFMPVPKNIVADQTVEILCQIKKEGQYSGTRYFIRYFQYEGQGALMFPDYKPFKMNVLYPVEGEKFKLLYKPKSKESHEFEIWISDNFGNERMAEFSFN